MQNLILQRMGKNVQIEAKTRTRGQLCVGLAFVTVVAYLCKQLLALATLHILF